MSCRQSVSNPVTFLGSQSYNRLRSYLHGSRSSSMAGLKNKVVIVTGASSGIGAQTAIEFAKHDSRLVLAARRKEVLNRTAEKCKQIGLDENKILVITADIMVDEDLRRVIQNTVESFGRIDILVNNAGVALKKGTFDTTVEDLDRMYKMHVRAVFVLTQLALPYIIQQKGSIVNVSSIAGLVPLPYALPYCVAKAAQDHYTKIMSLDLAAKGVRVNSVCPGSIKTEIFSLSGYTDQTSLKQLFDALAAIHPLKRVGMPEEVAKTIVFLASDDASFITGVTLAVDGGRANTSAALQSKI